MKLRLLLILLSPFAFHLPPSFAAVAANDLILTQRNAANNNNTSVFVTSTANRLLGFNAASPAVPGLIALSSSLSLSAGTLDLSTTPNIGAATGTSLSLSGALTAAGNAQFGTNGSAQGLLKLWSSGGASREGNIYSPASGGVQIDTNSNTYPIRLDGSAVNVTSPMTLSGSITVGGGTVQVSPSSGTTFGRINADPVRADVFQVGVNWTGSSQDDASKPTWYVSLDSRVGGDQFNVVRAPPAAAPANLLSVSATGTSVTGNLTASGTGTHTFGTTNMVTMAAGALATTSTVTIASTSAIAGVRTATAALNFPSTIAGAVADLTITVTGAAVGDTVSLGVPHGAVTATAVFFGWVSATDTVTVRFSPKATEDPASATFRATVTSF